MIVGASAPAHAQFETGQTTHYRFEWSPGLAGYGQSLMEGVEAHHARIYGELGVVATAPTTVTVLRDEEQMLAEAGARHGGRPPPHWADGLAYPETREIFLHVARGPDGLNETFQHEISHVAVGHFKHANQLPIWFQEGLAIRQSEGFAFERVRLLTEAAVVDGLLGLDELDRGYPVGGQRVGVAYAQSVHFVGWLANRAGPEGFRRLLARVGAGETLGAAIEAELGEGLPVLEQTWRQSLKVWWGWVPIIFGSTTLWAVATLLMILGWRRRRRQRLQRIERLQAEERVALVGDIEVVPRPGAWGAGGPGARSSDDPPRGAGGSEPNEPTIH